MDRDGHVILFPAKLKALVFMFMKNTFVSIKDHTFNIMLFHFALYMKELITLQTADCL